MIDPTNIGRTFPSFEFEVERGQIRALAAAIGDPNPLYRDVAVARAAGFPDLPAPPTLPTLFSLWANEALLVGLDQMGAPLLQLLHGEQEYEYHAPIHPGDLITGVTRVAGLQQKQGSSGPFQLLTLETTFTNQRGKVAVVERMVVVVRG